MSHRLQPGLTRLPVDTSLSSARVGQTQDCTDTGRQMNHPSMLDTRNDDRKSQVCCARLCAALLSRRVAPQFCVHGRVRLAPPPRAGGGQEAGQTCLASAHEARFFLPPSENTMMETPFYLSIFTKKRSYYCVHTEDT